MDHSFGMLGGRFGNSKWAAVGGQGSITIRNELGSGSTALLFLPPVRLFLLALFFWWRHHTERFLCMALSSILAFIYLYALREAQFCFASISSSDTDDTSFLLFVYCPILLVKRVGQPYIGPGQARWIDILSISLFSFRCTTRSVGYLPIHYRSLPDSCYTSTPVIRG